VNITYHLSLNEYQEASYFHYKTGKRPLFVGLFVGMATFMMLVGTDFSNTQSVIHNILMTFFALSFYILFTRMLIAYRAKKTYNKSPILSKEVTLHISGKGINLDKTNQGKIFPWSTFTRWKKNEKYYLIYTNAHQFNVIPLRAIDEKKKEELDGYLEKYL